MMIRAQVRLFPKLLTMTPHPVILPLAPRERLGIVPDASAAMSRLGLVLLAGTAISHSR